MSAINRIESTAKNIEGHLQEVYGKIIGDPEHRAKGKAKRTEAKARHTAENVKDKVKKSIE